MKSKKKIIILLIVVFALLFNITFADTYVGDDLIYINTSDKVFNISFSEKIDKSTVNFNTAVLKNIDYSITFEDAYTISLIPMSKYQENKDYSIHLSSDIRSETGEYLTEFNQDFRYLNTGIKYKDLYTVIVEKISEILKPETTEPKTTEPETTELETTEVETTEPETTEPETTEPETTESETTESETTEPETTESETTESETTEPETTESETTEPETTEPEITEPETTESETTEPEITEPETTESETTESETTEPETTESETTESETTEPETTEPETTEPETAEPETAEPQNTLKSIANITEIEKEVINFGEAITNRETYYSFLNLQSTDTLFDILKKLSSQSNIGYTLKDLDFNYTYEFNAEEQVWYFKGVKDIEYIKNIETYSEVVSMYKQIFNSLDLKNKTNLEKSEIIALYLLDKFEYSMDDALSVYGQSYYSIFKDKTVCAGYSTSYQYLLALAGIRSDLVNIEHEGVSHVYNKIYLSEDKITYTDLTFMDTSNSSSEYNYNYFNQEDILFGEPNKRKLKSITENYAIWSFN